MRPDPKLLGCLPEVDPRSLERYPLRALLTTDQPRSYTWSCGTWIDQGRPVDGRRDLGTCVGHSWAHEVAARPVVLPADSALALKFYDYAQEHDQWSGRFPDYSGTSVLAGAKAVQAAGLMDEYRWAESFNDALVGISRHGPGVFGTWWRSGMWNTDSNGVLHATGVNEGGHAYLVNGVSMTKRLARIHQSWGVDWGRGGDAFIPLDDLQELFEDGGECCIPVRRG